MYGEYCYDGNKLSVYTRSAFTGTNISIKQQGFEKIEKEVIADDV